MVGDLFEATRDEGKRVVGPAVLHREDLLHGIGGSRISGQTVERFCWKRDDPTLTQCCEGRLEIALAESGGGNAQMNHAGPIGDKPYNSPYFDSRYARYGAVEICRPVIRWTSSRGV